MCGEKKIKMIQYSWIKVALRRISASCLDQSYLQNNKCDGGIYHAMYYDPQLITVNVILSETKPQFFYWHFNVHDERFYERFYKDVKLFWNCWVQQKNDYNLLQWWEIMKTQIKIVNNFWHTIHVILNMRLQN